MDILWTYPNDERIEVKGAIGDLHIWITESSAPTLANNQWYWLIRNGGYDWSISDHCASDEVALAAVQHWLMLGEEAICTEWARQQLAAIDKLIAELGKFAPAAAMQLAGYAQGRQDGYEAARQDVAAALHLVPRDQLEEAESARIDAERMIDFERDYAASLEEQLGDLRTAQRALDQDGNLAVITR